MAEKFDGSLVFNTKMDTGEFKTGVKDIQKEIKDLESALSSVGKNALSIDTSKAQKDLQELAKQAKEAQIIVNNKLDATGFTQGTARAKEAIVSLKKELGGLGGILQTAWSSAFISNRDVAKGKTELESMLKDIGRNIYDRRPGDRAVCRRKRRGDRPGIRRMRKSRAGGGKVPRGGD